MPKCQSRGEITLTFANMEKKIKNIATNVVTMDTKLKKREKDIERNVVDIKNRHEKTAGDSQ